MFGSRPVIIVWLKGGSLSNRKGRVVAYFAIGILGRDLGGARGCDIGSQNRGSNLGGAHESRYSAGSIPGHNAASPEPTSVNAQGERYFAAGVGRRRYTAKDRCRERSGEPFFISAP